MAAACYHVSDKACGTSSNLDEDERLLQESAVMAVMFIGDYSAETVLKAARKVKSERGGLTAEDLQQAVECMACETQVCSMQSPVSKRKHHHYENLGSDGEEQESLPNIDHDEPQKMDVDDDDGDIQTDGEAAPSVRLPLHQFESEMAHKQSRELEPAVQCMGKNNSAADMKKRLRVLKSENQRLKERSMCKQCHSKPLSITFLPCGHYSYCYECGQAFSACPICKRTILADVRTFLA